MRKIWLKSQFVPERRPVAILNLSGRLEVTFHAKSIASHQHYTSDRQGLNS